MGMLVPIEGNPFAAPTAAPAAPAMQAAPAAPASGPGMLVPVEGNPFAQTAQQVPQDSSGYRPLTIQPQKPTAEIQVNPVGGKLDLGAIANAAATVDPANAPSMSGSALSGAMQGVSSNFGDENRGLTAASGISSLIPGSNIVGAVRLGAEALAPDVFGTSATDRYGNAVSRARAENRIAQQTNPGSYFAGELAGGLATLPITPELTPFKAAEGANLATRAAVRLGNMATTGATYGAASGVGGADGGLQDRVTGGLEGAALGGVINPAFGGAASAIGAGLRKVGNIARQDMLARTNPQLLSDQMIAQHMAADGTTPADLIQGMTNPPVPTMVDGGTVPTQGPHAPNGLLTAADVGGANLKGAVGTITRVPGEGQTPAREFLDARQFGGDTTPTQGDRAQAAITRMMGGKNLASDAVDQINARRSAQAAPAYKTAFSLPTPMTPTLADLLNKPSIKAAIPGAARKLADDLPGSSIFAKPGSQWERDVLGGHHVGEPDRPFAPLADDALMVTAKKPQMPRPQSLVNFLQSAGGVRDPKGDLKSMGLDSFPGLVKKEGGLSPDMARQAAAQAGYLGPHIDEAMANTGLNDLFDRMAEHPAYSYLDDQAVHEWEMYDAHRAAQDQHGRAESKPASGPAPKGDMGSQPANAPPEITTRGWDYIKRSLDDKISAAQRAGHNDDARIFTKLKQAITSQVDAVNPAYANARRIYAGESELLDAVEAGQKVFKKGMTVSSGDMAREMKGMTSAAEKESYRMSAAKSLKDFLDGLPDGTDKIRYIAGSPELRKKIEIIAPDDASRTQLMFFVNNERAMTQLRARATGGSPTATNLATDTGATDAIKTVQEGLHLAHNVASMNVTGLLMQAASHLQKVNPHLRSAVLNEMRQVILNPDPNAISSFAARVQASQIDPAAKQAVTSLLGTVLNRSTTAALRAGVGQTLQQQQSRPSGAQDRRLSPPSMH